MGHCDADMLQTFSKDEIELVAVADINPEQMKDAPQGVETYLSIEEMLENADINTVMISTPNPNHLEMVEKCAEAKKNIICEKPAAMTVEQFDRMVEVTEKNNVLFTVHQQRRWDKDYRIMKEVFDRQLVGNTYVVKSQLYGFNGNMHDWHIYPEMGGGMLYDWGVHLIDQILCMIPSEIDSLYADLRNVINEKVDDYFNIMIKFKNGITAIIELCLEIISSIFFFTMLRKTPTYQTPASIAAPIWMGSVPICEKPTGAIMVKPIAQPQSHAGQKINFGAGEESITASPPITKRVINNSKSGFIGDTSVVM